MAIRHRAPEFRVWTENVAGAIGDPVRRLRFLRAVATAEKQRRRRRLVWILVAAVAALAAALALTRASARMPPAAAPLLAVYRPKPSLTGPRPEVWQVESRGGAEIYSNGLRIEASFAVASHRRSYLAFPVSGSGRPVVRTEPAGIVFHSTESRQLPFEAGHNEALKRIGESLLEYLRRRRAYHFLIDRFGRVYRVVAESDAADHAGYSVWADDRWLYLNLNQSFLGVAFESRTGSGPDEPPATTAQVRSAVMLTEMLRARYGLPAGNCVTHAQVSVNPANMGIGWHVDWAAGFPFEQLGLTGNYGIPPPAIWAFGFASDPAFRSGAAPELQAAVDAAETLLERNAAGQGLRAAAYSKRLHQQYRERLEAVRRFAAEGRGGG